MEILKYASGGALFSALIAASFYQSLPIFLLFLPFGLFLFPLCMRKARKKERKAQLSLMFQEAIGILSGYLNAGYSPENAVHRSIPELIQLCGINSDIVREFQLIDQGTHINKSIESLFFDFGMRSGISDIRTFAEIFAIAKRSGGNFSPIISQTVRVLREKSTVNEEIKTLTASRRFEQRIMNMLPFLIVLYLNLTSVSFMDVLYQTVIGRLLMSACLLLFLSAYLWSNRILEIEF